MLDEIALKDVVSSEMRVTISGDDGFASPVSQRTLHERHSGIDVLSRRVRFLGLLRSVRYRPSLFIY